MAKKKEIVGSKLFSKYFKIEIDKKYGKETFDKFYKSRWIKMGVLDTYSNADFTTMNRPTGRGRFALYDYTATFQDKEWTVSRDNFGIVASDNNTNISSVNKQLAKDWIENDWKKRKTIEAGNNTPLDPGLADPDYSLPGTPDDSEDEEEIPDTSTDTNDPVIQSVGLTDDQRFMLIGLVVLGGLLGFIKEWVYA